jgi:hypothetical protein
LLPGVLDSQTAKKRKARRPRPPAPNSWGQGGRLGFGTRRVTPRLRRRLVRGRRDRTPRGGRRPRRCSRPVRRTRTRRGEASRAVGRASGADIPDGRSVRVPPARQRVGELAGHAFGAEGFGVGDAVGVEHEAAAHLPVSRAMLRSGSGSASARLGSASWTPFPVADAEVALRLRR